MKRIDTINARENMFGVGKSGFHDNADLPGQDATYVSPEWFNTVQEELCNLLELRGITLNPASKRQLYDLLTTQADLEALADEIETNFIRKSQIVDNFTTDDATKPLSAKRGKDLQDNKLDKTDLKDASTTQKGIVQLNNTLTSSATDEALTAEQGKVLHEIATGHKQYVLTNRTHSVAYQNPTDYLMFVNITAQSSSGSGREVETSQDGVTWTSIGQTGQSGDGENTFFVVLPRYFYRINGVTTSIAYWVEWRL